MQRSEKERAVNELIERLKATETLIISDYRGLTTSDLATLRAQLRQHGARFSVVKNTLTRRAAEAAGAESLLALLEGPSALAFIESGGDPVAVAKTLTETAKSTKVLAIKGGVLQGKAIGPEEVASLAKLPSADALQAQLVGALAAPLTTVVGLFSAPLRDLVAVLEARITQLEDQAQ
jgi:large subunit ribosomal protein L10